MFDTRFSNLLEYLNEFGEDAILTSNPAALDAFLANLKNTDRQHINTPAIGGNLLKEEPHVWNKTAASKASDSKAADSKIIASKSNTVAELRQEVLEFQDCRLKDNCNNTVFSDGPPNSKIMFIGEAPGLDEDIQGKPFVGQSGLLLNKMLLAIGINRSEVYITNVIFWRPPANRPPTVDEIKLCMPFLERHISLVKPKIIVLLGATAMKAVLKIQTGISSSRGKIHNYKTYDGTIIKTLVTFHPSYLLRCPDQKSLAWEDMRILKNELKNIEKVY